MKFPYKVQLCDSKLFVLDLHGGNDYFINVFEYPEITYLTSIGRKGKGGLEVISATSFDINADTLYLLEPHTGKMLKYYVGNISKQHNNPDAVENYTELPTPILSYKITPKGLSCLHNGPERNIIEVINSRNIITNKICLPLYDANDKVPEQFMPSLWDAVFTYDNQSGSYAVATKLGDVIEVVNSDGFVKSIIGKSGIPYVMSIGSSLSIGKVDGFSDIKFINGQIYAIYSGADRAEYTELWQQGINTPNGGNKLIVYNLNGEMVKMYNLDRHINGFDIDLDNKQIIGVDSNNSESPFCTFPIHI